MNYTYTLVSGTEMTVSTTREDAIATLGKLHLLVQGHKAHDFYGPTTADAESEINAIEDCLQLKFRGF